MISGIAMALGPTLGGLLASWIGWRWIFYANIPICIALAVVVPRLIPESCDPDGRPLDLLAAALLALSLCLAVDALLRRDVSAALRTACFAGSAIAALLFVLRQRQSQHPVFEPRVFATLPMAGVGALLLSIQFGYWAVLVYLPLFLSAALSIGVAGALLLAATLPMLLVPLVGGRLVARWGWRRYFAVAFAIMAVGDVLLIVAAVMDSAPTRYAAVLAGMATIGIGAALANPQMSSVVLALAPPMQAGVAVAATMIVRQAGFAISIAALGAVLATTTSAAPFAASFSLGAVATAMSAVAAMLLLPQSK